MIWLEREKSEFLVGLGDGWICDVAKDKRYMIKETVKSLKAKKIELYYHYGDSYS